jgi:DNA-binding CsgD family transcriptional regulator
VSGTRLIGRGPELEAIGEALEAAAGGESPLLLLRGEAGIGKTRLVEATCERARERRFLVVEGRAAELEHDVPFAPIVDALEPHLEDVPEARLQALGAERLGRLAGVLGGLTEAPGRAWTGDSPAERWRLHRALRDLLEVMGASRPLALVLDDVHWSDPATLEFLEHVVRRPPRAAHLLVLALRPGEPADRLLAARRASAPGGEVTLDLAPLRRDAGEALLEAVGEPAERERLFRESGGNPLLLEELARAREGEEVPSGITAAVAAELRGLPPAAHGLVEGGAIAGDPFDLDLAIAIAGLEEGEALPALDVIVTRALVRKVGGERRFAFRHPVIRSAVYGGIPAGARLAGHGAAAGALARAGAPLAARAHHLAHAATPGDAEAAAVLRAAAAVVRPQAPAIASDWLLAARRADPALGADGLSALAETLVEAGRLEAGLETVDEAAALPDPGEGELSVRLAVAGAAVERLLGRHAAARRRLERALEAAPRSGPAAARLGAELALAAYERGDYPETGRWAERARSTEGAGGLVLAASAALLAVMRAFAGDMAVARAEADTAQAAVDAATDEELAGGAELLTAVAWGLLALERLEAALAVGRRGASAARAGGNAAAAVPLDLAAVSALGLLGRIVEAVDAADQVEQAARITGNDQSLQWALWMRGWVLLEHGELDGSLAAAEESAALAERLDQSALVTISRAVFGAVLVARGEPATGRELLAAYDVEPGWICRWSPWLVEADLTLDDLDAAEAHAARAAALAEEIGLVGAGSAAARAGAMAAVARGDAAGGAELARGAAADAERAGALLDAARCRLVLGRALAGADREAAIRELEAAERQASAAGGRRVRDEAVRELRRLGRRVGRGGPRAPGETGLDSLSPREREIAELVAEGLTNREIAERLFLSEKTVETHLSKTFGKLAVRSRAEVAAQIAAGAAADLD